MKLGELEIGTVKQDWIEWDKSKPLPNWGMWNDGGSLGKWQLIETETNYLGEIRIRVAWQKKR